ncbi:cell wall integrity and stress response component 4 [Nematostella vectensis]|uniref:cell wall integrity and stress response component 4 n=1 Tax=Nematostella vectensis TaxID=45351 RepID=UPI0020773394|nr:cell wall integrity and stress response component 4 [Nematostella vectensis]
MKFAAVVYGVFLSLEVFFSLKITAQPCASPWQHSNMTNKCYLVNNDKVKLFHEAQNNCSKLGGQLFVEPDKEKWKSLFSEISGWSVDSKYYVGIKKNEDFVWQWLDKTPASIDGSGPCAYINFSLYSINTVSGSETCNMGYICQKEPEVPSSSEIYTATTSNITTSLANAATTAAAALRIAATTPTPITTTATIATTERTTSTTAIWTATTTTAPPATYDTSIITSATTTSTSTRKSTAVTRTPAITKIITVTTTKTVTKTIMVTNTIATATTSTFSLPKINNLIQDLIQQPKNVSFEEAVVVVDNITSLLNEPQIDSRLAISTLMNASRAFEKFAAEYGAKHLNETSPRIYKVSSGISI